MNRSVPITGELLKLKDQVEGYAKEYGLSFYDVQFEICDYDTINILAAQGGFPSRFPHWRFGMDYEQLSKGYAYGVQKIYEMVINTDPCYAYLLRANRFVDQKIVMAHVYGHADFFKNNMWFKMTNKRMMDVMANHGTKIRRYMEKYGQEEVEKFIDKVLSIENLIDVKNLFETKESERRRRELEKLAVEEQTESTDDDRSQALKSFMDNNKRYEKNRSKAIPEIKKEELLKFPVSSERDIMKFLLEHAHISEWQSDIIGILREESYYFLPQRMTKIMNEGWASYWHSTIMTKKLATAAEIIDFADQHAGVMQTSRTSLNPYKLGIELFRDIEYRWNTGKFGKEYSECTDMKKKENWDLKLGLGREKIFEVRRTHNDITFIDEFLTQEFCNRNQMFTYKFNPRTARFEIDTREFLQIKEKLLSSLTNFGSPIIEVEDGNFENRGELLLGHSHFGVDLDMGYAHDTMKNVHAIWKRPVNLKTKYDGREVIFNFDGQNFRPLT